MLRLSGGMALRGRAVRLAWVRGAEAAVQPFVSTVVNRLDAKGRVSVPAPYRQILAQQNLQGVYCIPSFSMPALEAFGETMLSQTQERLARYDPLFNPEYDDEAYAVLGRTQFLKFDDDGRVTLPADLIQHAGIGERVAFIGLGVKFQVWDPIRFEADQKQRIERARARRSNGGGA
jgi:transcriptional regulator MraZ